MVGITHCYVAFVLAFPLRAAPLPGVVEEGMHKNACSNQAKDEPISIRVHEVHRGVDMGKRARPRLGRVSDQRAFSA